MMKTFLLLGGANAFLAVALGAFGAHGLEGRISEKYLETWQTGVQYQMFHAIGLIAVAFLAGKWTESGLINWAGWLMFAGIILFSGSLYILSVTSISLLGAITPIGGVAFLTSWALMMVAVYKYL